MAEMRKFNRRLAEELAVDLDATPMASLLAAQPGSAQALADLKKESAKMSGLPVLQVTGIASRGFQAVCRRQRSIIDLNHRIQAIFDRKDWFST
jgi:hypothetical protein